MKVFYVAALESDYLQDSVYSGLCEILGKENVFEYPFHRAKHFKPKAYPRNLGFLKNDSLLSALLRRLQNDFLKQADLVVVASTKPETFRNYQKIQDDIPDHCRVIFLDGGDRPEIAGDLERLKGGDLYKAVTTKRPFDLIFKREYLLSDSHPENVIPLPFAINPALLQLPPNWQPSLIYDVTFWAVESDPVRTRALDLIENLWDCKSNGTERNQTFRKYSRKGIDYIKALSQCKVTLNFRGVGWDTLRYWEVTAMGRFLVSQKPQIHIPNNFRDHQEVIFCKDDLSDLVEICNYYLENETAREKMAAAAKLWSLKFHTHKHRAKTILDSLK